MKADASTLQISSNNPVSGIELRKELGLVDGVSVIIGIIVGSGIFVSPKGVIKNAGSVGLSLIIWVISGLTSLLGALCFAELGTMIPRSGGDYAYIKEAFGALPAFLFLWVSLMIILPAANAITALTFANYILQPIFEDCVPPYVAVRLIAAVTIGSLTFVNCWNVRWSAKITDLFTFTKIIALIIIIIAGFYQLIITEGKPLNNAFNDTSLNPGDLALSFYSGVYSFAGWNYLNFVTEELKDPFRNLPRAICISLPLITTIYLLANIAYFSVLTKEEIISSNAVAVTFSDRMLGSFAWTMPLFVACSTLGCVNGAIFASSRLCFVGARDGLLPQALSVISINRLTPIMALVFLAVPTMLMLLSPDIYVLINCTTFAESVFWAMAISSLLYLRWKEPDLKRPVRVHLAVPVIFLIVSAFVIIFPIYSSPTEVGLSFVIMMTGIPVYYCFIHRHSPIAVKISDFVLLLSQKLCVALPQEDKSQ